ncbi:MAG: hypothetical protein JSV24_06095 [Bacteroidales bacterium]|nr:MAG: hypothetical protein JSV24_06095 [Bacteroidales bacterium]
MEEQKSTAGQGLGIAGLILGIIAFIFAFIPCFGWVALIPGFIAVALSIVALTQANKANGAKGLIIAALVVSIIATSVAILQGFLFAGILSEGSHIKDRIERAIDDEIGTDLEEVFEDVEQEMEKALEDLEEDLKDAFEDLEDTTREDTTGFD